MIIWLASYPKNGNTWLRSLISAYYYTKDGLFMGDENLKNVDQFPVKKYLNKFDYNLNLPGDTSRFWVLAQEKINEDRKIRFFKTHNALVKFGKNDFTNRANSLGGIYIVRDPRNVLDSMSRHFQIDHVKALEVMQDKKNFTYDFKKKNDYSDYQFISSWELNYQSWKNNNLLPIKFLKYEDLLSETFFVFKEIVEFIDKLTNNKSGFNREKAKNVVKTTSFENLKKIEINKGFSESIISRTGERKIPFFHLGPKNNWKKNFNSDFVKKLNNIFKKNLDELDYSN
tara:strand:- start:367 stop:1221 length:855 start_codon:yes stop_codon:yes gene_type:complete